MKTLLNKTARPIKVPLPLGKILHLGPRRTGEIADKAIDHPPLAKLVAAGDLEVVDDRHQTDQHQAAAGSMRASSRGKHPAMGSQRRGDR